MKIIAVIETGIDSIQRAEMVFREFEGRYVIEWLHDQLLSSELLDDVIVAIPRVDSDTMTYVEERLHEITADYVRFGEPFDELGRLVHIGEMHNADYILRLSPQRPFVIPWVIDTVIATLKSNTLDYIRTVDFPIGLNVEIIATSVLKRVDNVATVDERKNVTLFFEANSYRFKCHDLSMNFDVGEDFEMNSFKNVVRYIR